MALRTPMSTKVGATGILRFEGPKSAIRSIERRLGGYTKGEPETGEGVQVGLQHEICLTGAWESTSSVATRVEPPHWLPSSHGHFFEADHLGPLDLSEPHLCKMLVNTYYKHTPSQRCREGDGLPRVVLLQRRSVELSDGRAKIRLPARAAVKRAC